MPSRTGNKYILNHSNSFTSIITLSVAHISPTPFPAAQTPMKHLFSSHSELFHHLQKGSKMMMMMNLGPTEKMNQKKRTFERSEESFQKRLHFARVPRRRLVSMETGFFPKKKKMSRGWGRSAARVLFQDVTPLHSISDWMELGWKVLLLVCCAMRFGTKGFEILGWCAALVDYCVWWWRCGSWERL